MAGRLEALGVTPKPRLPDVSRVACKLAPAFVENLMFPVVVRISKSPATSPLIMEFDVEAIPIYAS
jgi:hypothetical protein